MKIKNNIAEIIILSGVFLILIYSTDPLFYPDSNRYLNGNLNDPPLYSTIIFIMQSIFKNLNSVIVLQTLFIGFSIIYFVRTVTIYFNLNLLLKTLISLFLFIPIIQFYRHLLTEPFSYALSLMFAGFVFKLIFDFNYRNLVWTTIFVIALLLIRNQFIFLYPVILLLYLGILMMNNSLKKISFLLISILSIFFIHNFLISLNKYIDPFERNKIPSNTNKGPFYFTYIDAIYISDPSDVELFKDSNYQNTLTEIFIEMDNKKALLKHYNGRGHFGLSLIDIRNYSDVLLKNLAKQKNTSEYILKKNISIKLIKANFKKYIKHIFKKAYDSSWLFVFVPFFMLLGSLISFLYKKTHFSLAMLFLSIFALANHSTVYLFGRVQPRYFIYSDFILLIFIFITFAILLKDKKNKF